MEEDEAITVIMPCSLDEMLDTVRSVGGEVERGIVTETGDRLVQAND